MQVDGLVITTTNPEQPDSQGISWPNSFPFVVLYSTVRRGPMSCVGVDNFRGGYMATQHLIGNGHRRIAMIAGDFPVFRQKSQPLGRLPQQCLRENGIAYDSRLLLAQTTYSLASGREVIQQMLQLETPPTAVFCSNDYLAIGVMEGAREIGARVCRWTCRWWGSTISRWHPT